MKKLRLPILLFLFLSLPFIGSAQQRTGIPGIEGLIQKGDFTKASLQIDGMLATKNLTELEKYQLNFQKDILHRIILDFLLAEKEVRDKLKPYFPNLDDRQMRAWENDRKLEMRVIDGERLYFKVAVSNLFRLDSLANKVKNSIDKNTFNGSPEFLKSYLPVLMDSFRMEKTSRVDRRTMTLTYTVTLKADAIPTGETVRCWLPFPKEGHDRQSNIKLLRLNNSKYILAPFENLQRSIYCEKTTEKGVPTVFELEFSFDCQAEWQQLANKQVKPYDLNTEIYKTYTAERPPQLVFSDRIKKLTAQVVGNETDPFKKVQRIYRWIDANIPWCSALEYSTLDNIPEYVLTNRHGDCGQQTLLFMTMARCAGIPCKWQSGWMLHPGEINLHDWCEVYYEGFGWVPLDQSFEEQNSINPDIRSFYISGIDGYRLIVNDDYAQPLFPEKIYPRSETLDFQRGEMEWRGGNIYFDCWKYNMKAVYSR
ncbi:MAG: transglutaminase domain-containing protein [Paludibacter sp.]|nr:transglutaminase domain-containing protein [Paludibacter sp.]